MKMRFKELLIVALFPVILIAGEDADRWQAKMNSLSRILPGLLQDLRGRPHMYSPEARERIKKNAKELSELAHQVHKATEEKGMDFAPATDPGVGFLAEYLEKETRLAANAIEEGHWEYGRRSLKSVAGYCISCHTRNQSGKEFPSFEWNIDEKGLSPMEKAELAAATRQFDRAFEEFREIVLDEKFAHSEQLSWLRALKYTLGLGVRYKRDPAACLDLLKRIQKFGVPAILASRQLVAWQTSLEEWEREGKKKSSSAEAKRLLAKARKKQQYPADHSADIDFLRLTAVAHDLLTGAERKPEKNAETAELLHLSGIAYEALDFPDLWSLHESYYQKCIELQPHTALGRQCYDRLEDSIVVGFSGSGGVSIPASVRTRLEKLRELALPKK